MKNKLIVFVALCCITLFTGCKKEEETTCKIEVQHWYQYTFNTKVYYSSGDKVFCIKGTTNDYSVDENCLQGKVFNVKNNTYQPFSKSDITSSGKAYFNVHAGDSYLLVAFSSWGYAYKFIDIPSNYTLSKENVFFIYDYDDHISNWVYVKKNNTSYDNL